MVFPMAYYLFNFLSTLDPARRSTGVAGRAAEDHPQYESQQPQSDDVFKETVSEIEKSKEKHDIRAHSTKR